MKLTVEAVSSATSQEWLRLRKAFWSNRSETEHNQTIEDFLVGHISEPAAVFLARSEDHGYVGLLELSIRAYSEGCEAPNPAYIEGVYVKEGSRRSGVAHQLIAAAEEWARARGCCDLGSDSAPENNASAGLHHNVGFRDIGLVRCWAKRLD
jgi:aminoglycoside 6'-N-acetyltransferase I